jgi:hypothetical protein
MDVESFGPSCSTPEQFTTASMPARWGSQYDDVVAFEISIEIPEVPAFRALRLIATTAWPCEDR